MSQKNVEIVRDAFQTFGAEGIDAALSFFSPDLVWYPTDRWLEGDAYRGHDGMRSLEAAFAENFDDFRYEVHDVRDAQDRVVALVDMTGESSTREWRSVSDSGSWFRASAMERSGTFARSRVGMKPWNPWGCRSSPRAVQQHPGSWSESPLRSAPGCVGWSVPPARGERVR
jgi:ketosteroid isomerase-like protein